MEWFILFGTILVLIIAFRVIVEVQYWREKKAYDIAMAEFEEACEAFDKEFDESPMPCKNASEEFNKAVTESESENEAETAE